MANIEHKGIVTEIGPKSIIVELIVESACASCHLKGACSSSDTSTKRMEVAISNSQKYIIGQSVTVCVAEKKILKLVIITYIVPVIIAIAMLLILTQLEINEAVAGLTTLAGLTLYFIVLHLIMKNRNSKLDITIGNF